MTHPLNTLLDEAHRALIAGDLAGLGALAPRLEGVVAAAGPLDPVDAGLLRQKAQRNAHLLQAALRGLRAARGRVAELSTGPVLTTYDARGQRLALPALPPAPVRRF